MTASQRMAIIKTRNTQEEKKLASALWNRGLRFRRNQKSIKGSPDISIKKYKLAIFVDGEFWHGFDWERRQFDLKTNAEFWKKKIERNMARDAEIDAELKSNGWTVLRFWSAEVKKNLDDCVELVMTTVRNFGPES